jgi:hypothetical protein
MREYYHRIQGVPLGVKILHDHEQIWPEKGWATVALGDLTGVAHHVTLNVAAGDVVRFVLDRERDKGTAPERTLLAWMPQIIYEQPKSATPAAAVVRILCGANTSYTDRCGNRWVADQYFTGGDPVSTTEKIEDASPTPEDQPLYQHGRAGKDFSYAIPVPTGLYVVRLKFVETKHPWMFERPMNLKINGREMLKDFDILQAAKGPQRAVEQTFRNVIPNAEGKLVLHFTAGENPRGTSDDAIVQAMEILPAQKRTVRIKAGSDIEFVDWNSCVWSADTQFTGGTAIKSPMPVVHAGAPHDEALRHTVVHHASPTLYDQELYRTARSGKQFGYAFAVSPGSYTVHLKFAELWLAKPGQRPMDIEVNNRLIWKSWDPATAAGRMGMAADIRVEDITPGKDGRITICVRAAGANDAILQGIEIE